MSYLKDFQKHIANNNYPYFLKLWEEYCSGDEVDGPELIKIFSAVKLASFVDLFGKQAERILPLWEKMEDRESAHKIFSLLVDIDNTQNPKMGERVSQYLKDRFGTDADFAEKIRLIGFRSKEKFQGAVSHYELLSHMKKGNFVFHGTGWGVGVIKDCSILREQLTVEFDCVPGKKDLSFATAFKTLVPISSEHFLARRFGDPDRFEAYAKEHPVETIKLLLRDLGPKTASDMKEELCELVIPEQDWGRWWQNVRAKLKKDPEIVSPGDAKETFAFREEGENRDNTLETVFASEIDLDRKIRGLHAFVKDYPEVLKVAENRALFLSKLQEIRDTSDLLPEQRLQLAFLSEEAGETSAEVEELVTEAVARNTLLSLLSAIPVVALKKRVLLVLRGRSDWAEIFLRLLLCLEQAVLRDYILSELLADNKEKEVIRVIEELYNDPSAYPDAFLWYFQKVSGGKKVPFADMQGRIRFFESFLILLSRVEGIPERKDLVRKMHTLLSSGRYALVREIMASASKEEVREFLLLATKCHSIDDHEIKILHSLAEVAHPSLAKGKKKEKDSDSGAEEVIWTTEKGYEKLQERIRKIATVETVENAKEIETARAHGDLRENAEFKASLEKRDRLQSELKSLSDQLNRARIITKQDVVSDMVGVGSVVTCKNGKGEEQTYTLLGPWDADPENNILALQSKLAQAMKGCSVGDSFTFQGDSFTVTKVSEYSGI